MDTLSPLARRIQKRLDATRQTPRGASVAAGLGASTIRNIIEGRSEYPRTKTIQALARVLNTTPQWLMDEIGPEEVEPDMSNLVESYDPDDHAHAGYAKREGQASLETSTARKLASRDAIPEFDLRAGASYGGGYLVDILQVPHRGGETYSMERPKDEWVLPRSFLEGELRLSRATTHIIAIDGPSMLPDLAPGDRVLIDLSYRDPRQGGIFAVREGESVIVKHVDYIRGSDPPRIKCSSSNPQYHPFELILDGADNAIIGRVACRIARM